MKRQSEFRPIHKVLVPLVHEGPGIHALEVARHLDGVIVLVGVVVVPVDQSLGVGARAVSALCRQLRHYGKDPHITAKTQIIVSYLPCQRFRQLVSKSFCFHNESLPM